MGMRGALGLPCCRHGHFLEGDGAGSIKILIVLFKPAIALPGMSLNDTNLQRRSLKYCSDLLNIGPNLNVHQLQLVQMHHRPPIKLDSGRPLQLMSWVFMSLTREDEHELN